MLDSINKSEIANQEHSTNSCAMLDINNFLKIKLLIDRNWIMYAGVKLSSAVIVVHQTKT